MLAMEQNLESADFANTNANQNTQCTCLQNLQNIFRLMFHKLGYTLAIYPLYFIIIPFCLTLICVTGLSMLIYIDDPEYLFCPNNAKSWHERNITESLFPLNYSHGFDPSRIVKSSAGARLLISAKDNRSLFRTRVWNSVKEVDRIIAQELNISWEGYVYTYQDVCAKFDGECIENDILRLDEIMTNIEAGTVVPSYPIMLYPLLLPFYYGEIEVNKTEGVVTSVKSLSLNYWLKEGNNEEKERAGLFEKKVLQLLGDVEFENITIVYSTSSSFGDEMERNATSLIPYIVHSLLIILFIAAICMFEVDWVRSKMQIGLIGITTAGLATGCSFGFLMLCQVPFPYLNLAAPFLLLGIGLDDMFVLLSAWKRTDVTSDVATRLANTYSEAAISITITSLTNMVSFLLGATSPFPAVFYFCLYTGFAIFVTYIFFITFFGGWLALAGRQEQQQRHAVTFKIVKSKSETENMAACNSIWCTGGINRQDPDNPKDNEPVIVMTFFKTHVAYALNKPTGKALVLGIFVLYITGAIYGIFHTNEGLENKNLVLANSYLIDFYAVEETQFRKFPHRIQIVIHENITYSDPEVKKQLLDLHTTFENLSYIAPKIYTESWIRRFYNFLERRQNLSATITDEASFIQILKEHFLVPDVRDYLDVVISEDESQILASRFIIQSFDIKNAIDEKDMMMAVRNVAQNAPFDVVVNHPLFVYYDQFLAIRSNIFQTIAIVATAMMLISMVFIPNPFCSVWVTFSILSIITGLVGYMSLWGVKLDVISMVNLILCVGFSVDFSAHISYAYLTAKASSPKERIEESLYNLGLPILQSGVTTIGGMMMFLVNPSYIKYTFIKIISMVIIFGTLHALFLLPVLLSLLGPDTFKNNSTNEYLFFRKLRISIWFEGRKIRLGHNTVHSITIESGESKNNKQELDEQNCQPICITNNLKNAL